MALLRTELLRFGLAGIAGLAVDVGVLYAALAAGSTPLIGRVLSFLAAVYATWQINRRYTFAAAAAPESAWRQWWRYLGAMAGGGAVNYAVYCAVTLLWPATLAPLLAPLVGVALGSLAGMAVNFLSAKFLIFKTRTRHAR